MTEELLHYLWKFRMYKPELYKTHDGQSMEIINTGIPNNDAGSDFFNAKIKIGETLWAGNVEIHIKSSDWNRHGHQNDKAYDNVILHVVAEHDTPVKTSSGAVVQTWIMPIEQWHIDNYNSLIRAEDNIPCSHNLKNIEPFEITAWIERMAIEKLENKTAHIRQLLDNCTNDWDNVFYIMLARNFGFGLNSEPFEQLARQTPWTIVLKNIDNIKTLEALFIGQAGFLDDLMYEDKYIQDLCDEYRFLKHKYNLTPIPQHQWKFLRLRPFNFPTIRLMQFVQLIYNHKLSADVVINEENIKSIHKLLKIKPSTYWETHFRPNVESPQSKKELGESSKDLIIINTIIPFLFAYGKLRGNEKQCDKAFLWFQSLKPERNSILNSWKESGIVADNALQSQALIHLNRSYCVLRKCLTCRVGHLVISKKC